MNNTQQYQHNAVIEIANSIYSFILGTLIKILTMTI